MFAVVEMVTLLPQTAPPNSSMPPNRLGYICFVALTEQQVYVSEKQRADLAAGVIQRWWAVVAGERLRRMGEESAAVAVQAMWRGRAGRLAAAVRWEERKKEEEELRVLEVRVLCAFFRYGFGFGPSVVVFGR